MKNILTFIKWKKVLKVCCVLVVLCPIISVLYGVHLVFEQGRRGQTNTIIGTYVGDVKGYENWNFEYPSTIEAAIWFSARKQNRDMSIREDMFRDGWGTRMIYEKRSNGFSIISAGPDKKFHTPDDIVTNICKDDAR